MMHLLINLSTILGLAIMFLTALIIGLYAIWWVIMLPLSYVIARIKFRKTWNKDCCCEDCKHCGDEITKQ